MLPNRGAIEEVFGLPAVGADEETVGVAGVAPTPLVGDDGEAGDASGSVKSSVEQRFGRTPGLVLMTLTDGSAGALAAASSPSTTGRLSCVSLLVSAECANAWSW